MPPQNQSNNVLEHPDTTAIKVHEIAPLRQRVDQCYSREKYEEFQDAVEKIVLKTIGGENGIKKIKEHATESAKSYFSSEMWKQKTFWIPTVIGIAGVITAIVAVFLKK